MKVAEDSLQSRQYIVKFFEILAGNFAFSLYEYHKTPILVRSQENMRIDREYHFISLPKIEKKKLCDNLKLIK